ncbi:MAG: NADH-quinone oxidoreductase subunit C [Flavobacterium sp. BFFFF1]|uniref:NADH-quinone oxidoreductase subunit C n=1 Tax=unclassified Flavobacterium TaxID=196869 RepID=UPI000BD0124B|nr:MULTISPECIES: NADH-quinone oxidoreductase subunit C [unclassified Flavobacterium]OYU82209.1 MAG: NADH-quinone oxidoreductase subunit C [Flavobacterium sp. BFFFF1]
MALENSVIQNSLTDHFGSKVSDFIQIHDILTFEVDTDAIIEVMQFLRDDKTMRFNFLTDLCGMHFPDASPERQFGTVYHMHNWLDNVRIRIKCFMPADKPEIDTVTGLFLSANWQERETYDFYGIIFKGHPQLKRILNMDEMVSFPMRKEFPMEDGGRTDKDDRFFGRTTDNC